ncbi:DUF386 domain-containing protein [Desulfuromonas versatilis]|uniref:DUF386 domain-containing protein n=1 Tax=Desulfuromonas versatilis TaxID=2802975 RepID=A0ABM8I0P3_9BACT|nr:YhcH/YjgK/YiaL family protein [Desulfuromonas versatilis]BCR06890.1 DUF386 domain-containing protein [Desulfuromonas versatilis]
MVIDSLDNAARYAGLGQGIARALEYLAATDLAAAADGRYEIDGERIFAMIQSYPTKPPEQGFWEAHRRYVDVQYVVSGTERFGYANLAGLQAKPYDEQRDLVVLEGTGDFFEVGAGSFVILFPQDAHMPGLQAGAAQQVKKVVVKVAV